jgi:hypothetical protein
MQTSLKEKLWLPGLTMRKLEKYIFSEGKE